MIILILITKYFCYAILRIIAINIIVLTLRTKLEPFFFFVLEYILLKPPFWKHLYTTCMIIPIKFLPNNLENISLSRVGSEFIVFMVATSTSSSYANAKSL